MDCYLLLEIGVWALGPSAIDNERAIQLTILHVALEFKHANFLTNPLPGETLEIHGKFVTSFPWCLCLVLSVYELL